MVPIWWCKTLVSLEKSRLYILAAILREAEREKGNGRPEMLVFKDGLLFVKEINMKTNLQKVMNGQDLLLGSRIPIRNFFPELLIQ